MKKIKLSWLGLMLLFSVLSHAAEPAADVRFKSGEMGFLPFLEMVSEKLDIQVDASSLGAIESEKITVPEMGALSREKAEALVLTTLYLKGYAWIHDSATADLYRIVRQKEARDEEVPVIVEPASLPDSDLLVTYIMKMQHTSPEYIARMTRSFMPAYARIIPDETTMSVLITDSAHNVAKLRNLVQQIDTPEVAKEAKEYLAAREKKNEASCQTPGSGAPIQQTWLLIALFSLITLVIGFLLRGYVIRRIEGGL